MLRWEWYDWYGTARFGFAPVEIGDLDFESEDRLRETFYKSDELEHYGRLLCDSLHLRDGEVTLWMQRTRDEGWDEVLKTLLIALAPGLRSLKFAR